VEADLRVVAEFGHQRADPVADLLQHERPGRVDHVDALAAGVGHDPACLASASGGWECAIIRKPTVSSPSSRPARSAARDVGLGAVGGDPADRGAVIGRGQDVVGDPDAGQHQERDPGLRRGPDRRLDQFLLRGVAEPVGERRAAEPVPVRHLDHRDAGRVEAPNDRRHLGTVN
jgi:hypothetical protein